MESSAGVHLIMDGYVDDSAVFNQGYLEVMFSRIITALEMQPLDEARFYEVPVDPKVLERVKRTGKFEDEGGCSMLQVITTSHISIHTWPLQRFFSLDAFSCQDFNSELAQDIVTQYLAVIDHNTTVVKRRRPAPGQQVTRIFEV